MLKSAGLIIITALFIYSVNIFSQSKDELNKIDSISFAMYSAAKWNSLINYFEDHRAIVNSNYYFLMRRGIAYYSEADYVSASEDFKTASKLDPLQDGAKEYLYYSYLNLGRKSDADILAAEFTQNLKSKVKYKSPKFFAGIYTENSYAFGSSITALANQNPPSPYLFIVQGAPANYIYNNISLFHSIGNRVSLFQSYNHFSFKSTKQYNILFYPQTVFDLSSQENDYYAWLNVNAGKGFSIGGGMHYMSIKTEDVSMVLTGPSQPQFTNVTGTLNEYSAGLAVTKYAGKFVIGINGNIANMNSAKQFQTGLNLTFLPMGNLNLYFNLIAQLCSNKLQDSAAVKRVVIEPKIGFSISKYLWAEAYYTIGDIYNYSEDNLFTVFNNSQKINQRFGLNLIIPVTYNKLELNLRYQYLNLQQENAYYFNPVNYEIKTTSQSINKITGGLKWSF